MTKQDSRVAPYNGHARRKSIFEQDDSHTVDSSCGRRTGRKLKDWGRECLRPQHSIVVIVTTIACVTAGVLVYLFMLSSQLKTIEVDFQNTASIVTQYADTILQRTLLDMSAIRAGFSITDNYLNVSLAKFQGLIDSRGGMSASVQSLQWAPKIDHSLRASMVQRARVEQNASTWDFTDLGASGFSTAPNRTTYYPLYFVAPVVGNEAVRGWDMTGDATRKATLENARDTASSVCTTPIVLAGSYMIGIVCFEPCYSTVSAPSTIAGRQSAIIGYAVGVFYIDTLFNQIVTDTGETKTRIRLSVYDNELGLIYRSGEAAFSAIRGGKPTDVEAVSSMRFSKTLTLAGRPWTVVAVPLQSWLDSQSSVLPIVTLVGFLLAIILVTVFVAMRAHNDMILRKYANEKQSLVDRLLPVPVGRVLIEAAAGADKNGDGEGAKPLVLEIPFACVIFLDLVGFTNFSQNHDVHAVVDLLYDLFMTLDGLADFHSVTKVKTIGDAWLGSSGLFPQQHAKEMQAMKDNGEKHEPQQKADEESQRQSVTESGRGPKFTPSAPMASSKVDLAQQLAVKDSPDWRLAVLKSTLNFALDAREQSLEIFRMRGFEDKLNLRIGIHCGPVVGAVIGLHRPLFDIWAPVVNVASRLESTSSMGLIQVSSDVVQEWKRNGGSSTAYAFEERLDPVTLKGVGEVKTYWLHGPGEYCVDELNRS